MNILEAIANGDSRRFLEILDKGVKAATKRASEDSHALGLEVADGRAAKQRLLRRD